VIRHMPAHVCGVCGGHDHAPRGAGVRCAGFTSDDSRWCHCEREEHAGELALDERTAPPTFAHLLDGPCRCGVEHGAAVAQQPARREAGRQPRKTAALYLYHRADGVVLFRVRRFAPKGFQPEHPTDDGGWTPGMNGTTPVLYRLPSLTAAPGRVVFVTEGEKDADRLASLGLMSTTNAGGSASWRKHAADYCEAFRGRSLAVVLVDNDLAGRKWAGEVAASIAAVDCPVVVLELPDLPEGGDVSDWLDAGHTVEELKARVASAQRWAPEVSTAEDTLKPEPARTLPRSYAVCISDVEREDVEWLWYGRIARGKITLIDGDPGQGKSVLTTDTAARVTTGNAWPDGQPCLIRGPVLLLGAEDAIADTVRPRLEATGADISQTHALPTVGDPPNQHQPSIPDDLDYIEAALIATGAVLLVIDPLMAYLAGTVNSYRDQDVRRALAPLQAMIERLRVAAVVIRHLNKSSGGPAVYRGGGSIGLAGAARIVLAVGLDPEDETRRILAPVKANLTEPSPSLAYRLVADAGIVRIDWLGSSDVTAAQLMAAPVTEEDRSALDAAVAFLRELLSNGASVTSKDVQAQRAQAAITYDTLRRAQQRLRIKPHKDGMSGPWMWSLPAEDVDADGKLRIPNRYTPSGDLPHLLVNEATDLHGQEIPTSPSKSDGQVGETWASRDERPRDALSATPCPECHLVGWLKRVPGGYRCRACEALSPAELVMSEL
jgi:putative DNA primase/helicase